MFPRALKRWPNVVLTGALLAVAGPAATQTQNPNDLITRAAPPSLGGEQRTDLPPIEPLPLDGQEVDESAVRYYGANRQTDRVNAEIRRLQRLYPNWRVPDDLYRAAEPEAADEEELWALFARDQLAELRLAIRSRMESQPGWRPSADLSSKLARKELRLKVLDLYNKGDIDQIIALAQGASLRPQTTDIDILWIVAEAYAKVKRTSDAQAIYQAILSFTTRTADRVATFQKAMANLPLANVEPLLALAKRDADGKSEIEDILIDITRARITAILADQPAQEVAAADWQSFTTYARAATGPGEASLAAWYAFKRNDVGEAFDLFKVAMDKGGDAMVAHGLAHSMLRLGMRREAEEVAYAWRDLVNNTILFIDILADELTRETPPFVEPARLTRYGQVTMATASGQGAQALGWYAYNSCQYEPAEQWFERAVAWHPKGTTAMGLALALQRLKRRQGYVELTNRYDGLFPEVVGLVFDDVRRPPNPCDIEAQPTARRGANTTRQGPQGRYITGSGNLSLSGGRDNSVRDGYGRVTSPTTLESGGPMSTGEMPRFDRKEFPIAVSPQNNYRFPPTGGTLPPGGGNFLREPFTGTPPLVARRVPGVGPMPYERFGFTLLPGWNGTTTPTSPPASAQAPPAGTLWANEKPSETTTTDVKRLIGIR